MSGSKVLQRLIWKDARTVAPLAIAVLFGLLMLGILQWVFFKTSELRPSEQISVMYAVWMLMPNLFALGAPALLVGGEEESGTLGWLRTLPVAWRQITRSKMIVAVAGWLFMIAVSSIVFFLHLATFTEASLRQIEYSGFSVDHLELHLLGQAVFGLALLLVSFATAYFFRSPISGLVAVAPVMVFLAVSFAVFSDRLSRIGFSQAPWLDIWNSYPVLLIAACGLFLTVLFVIQWLSAMRRLRRVATPVTDRIAQEAVSDAFRPPRTLTSWYAVALAQKPPRPFGALLWQTVRQAALPLGSSAALLVGGALLYALEMHPLSLMLISAAILLIGGSTFYGDSVRKRCVFLYDRGLRPTLVWFTRVLPTLIGTLLAGVAMLAVIAMSSNVSWEDSLAVLGAVMTFYALCQLTSLWSPRPTLVFFAAPVLYVIGTLALGPLFSSYPRAVMLTWLAVPLFLFASWSMTPRWMAGVFDRWTSARLGGYLAASVLVPYVLVISFRGATMPPLDLQWREQMMTMDLDLAQRSDTSLQITDPSFEATTDQMRGMSVNRYDAPEEAPLMTRLTNEVSATEEVGRYVTTDELIELSKQIGVVRDVWIVDDLVGIGAADVTPTQYQPTEQDIRRARQRDLLVAKALAKHSRIAREKALIGEADYFQIRNADLADLRFTGIVDYYMIADGGVKDDVAELAEVIMSPELRKQSRIAAIVTQYRNYRTDPQRNEFLFPVRSPRPAWMVVERVRIDRYIDEVTKLMLNEERSGGRFRGVSTQNQLFAACSECREVSYPSLSWQTWLQRSDFGAQLNNEWVSDQEYARVTQKLKSGIESRSVAE